MRRLLVLLLAAPLVAGCGGGGSAEPSVQSGTSRATPAEPGTLGAILARPGPEVTLVAGTSDYGVGPVRVSFLVVRNDGSLVQRPSAKVWVGTKLSSPPLLQTTATLEPTGVPGTADTSGTSPSVYVARFRVARPGTYTLVAQPAGAAIQGIANVVVRSRPVAPAIGDAAIPSRTPTIASTHGDFAALTTRTPPDRALLRHSVADSLAAHVPFVVVFATPKFCTSRTCGPTVDVVDAVRKQFAGRGIRFIHVEIYRDNDPSKGPNRWVRQWHLPTEPFTFLVGSDGRIKARFEGAVSVGELAAAVRRLH